jgi:hypothetical protein
MPGKKWALYNGQKNAGSYDPARWVDSGMPIAVGKTYAFTIVLDPGSLTYDATISDGNDSVTRTNLGFRDSSFSIPNTLILNSRIGNATNILTVSVDTITVSPKPVPQPLISEFGVGAGVVRFHFSGEPGERYIVEKATHLVAPVVWQTIQTTIGTNGMMQAADVLGTNQNAFFRVRVL